ncbi:FIST C-terminal domain-containing protein [Chitinibacter bivalviorum]|uniref:FIST C-terminal domain-containing protein n=1 Tax=Chitinibacter bivalviorum TaxID=2739434 RepID=A0A7H9BJ24_9NEIS|nr:FIST C-terminal domain-containing protein [Chitinibacter bivalviorum]QLG88372.1 FIST C-terminal domain-containing protein [Chitinibacter bivalviorum]
MKPASGYAYGPKASTQVAIAAVSSAMARGGITHAGKVFLFLSTHFQPLIDDCLRAIVQISGSLDIVGASAAGVFTEQDWSLDSPAAAALVLPINFPTQQRNSHLALAAPNAVNQFWLNDGAIKFGGIAGDATGQGHFALWQAAQQRFSYIQIPLEARNIIVSDGTQTLSPALTITASHGLTLETLDHLPALNTLGPLLARFPSETLLAQISSSNEVNPNPLWVPVIGTDLHRGSVMLAHELPLGAELRWGHFDAHSASNELAQQIIHSIAGKAQPQWALAFSSHRRAMAGDGLSEPDWNVLRKTLPDVPFAGFYGNGQIIPLAKINRVVDNSVLLALFD